MKAERLSDVELVEIDSTPFVDTDTGALGWEHTFKGELSLPKGSRVIVPSQGGTPRGKGRDAKKRKHPVWGLVDPVQMSQLRLSQTQNRILFTILAHISLHENIARISQAEMARDLELAPTAISRGIAELRRRKIIFSEGRGLWRVSLWLYYRGETKEWEALTESDPALVLA